MKLLLIFLAVLSLSGCVVTLPFSLAATGASYVITGKSISDNLYSHATNQDCAIHRALMEQSICSPQISQQALAFVDNNKQGLTSATANP